MTSHCIDCGRPCNIVNQIRAHISNGGSAARYWDRASRNARIRWRVFAHLPEYSANLVNDLEQETADIRWEALSDTAHIKLENSLHMTAILIDELSAQTRG